MNPISTGLSAMRQLVTLRGMPGASPGTLHTKPGEEDTEIRVMSYGANTFEERVLDDLESLPELLSNYETTWVDVDGLADLDVLRRLAQVVGLHPLALEDAVNSRHRAKVESYPAHDFIVVRMVSLVEKLDTEQLSLFIGKNFVVTLQGGRPGDSLQPVRERLRAGFGKIRHSGSSYLAYALVDAVTDFYFPILEEVGERLEQLELGVTQASIKDAPMKIYSAKHELLALRRLVLPLRDAARALARDAGSHITDDVRMYFRDTLDHAIQLADVVDSYREVAGGLMDIHFSTQGQRMNEVMKFLTLISTIFIPLSFIAGLYGMNFDTSVSEWNMPELRSAMGYPATLGVMASLTLGLLIFFWRRGWLR